MAKTRHNNILDSIDELITNAKNKGVLLLNAENEEFTGRDLIIEGRTLVNFGTLGYLGLEQHPKLKAAGIDAINRYGMQFSASRTYISLGIHEELEHTLSQVFEKPTLVSSTSTSLGHLGVLPSIIHDEDAIILDHQVHASIQNAVKLVQMRGVAVEMIRHNNMEMLVEMIKRLGRKYRKIWYMIDGVFSMYGDLPPIKQIIQLLDEHEQLHLYVDDAHGISWAGKHGRGYTLSQVPYHPKMIFTATMGKAFGVSGGIFTFPDQETFRKVKTFGGALVFSVPAAPPVLAACLASAKIHLTDEITVLQNELQERIAYCNECIREMALPQLTENCTPIFFIPVGTPETGYNMVKRVMNDGYFVNLSIFPAVPVKNTGIRFSISRNVSKEDIRGLISSLAHHMPLALKEEGKTIEDVRKAFRMSFDIAEEKSKTTAKEEFKVVIEKSIRNIDAQEWDRLVGVNGSFDSKNLELLEQVCQGNERPEENWNFYYTFIRDHNSNPIVAAFYTHAMWKDDMLAPAKVSEQIEKQRETDFYYLTSEAFTLGSFFSEGQHIYINRQHPEWKKALNVLLQQIESIAEKHKVLNIVLRDFEASDAELKDLFLTKGYVKVDMPESSVVEELKWNTNDEFLNLLSPRNKKHMKQDVFKYEDRYEVEVVDKVDKATLEYLYSLHINVKNKNLDLNTFSYPYKLFSMLNDNPQWEFVILKLKPEYDQRAERKPVAVAVNYKSVNAYCFIAVGMDYDYLLENKLYRQMIFQTLKRAKALDYQRVALGLTANIEKKKFGALTIPKVAYVQAKDNYSFEKIESIAR